MVVSALIAYYAPSSRGFVRIKDSEDVPLDLYPIHDDPLNSLHHHNNLHRGKQMTARRRKPLRAMAVLTSIAADFDLVSDWCFFQHSLREDRQYQEEFAENPVEGALPYLIPDHLLISVLLSCIFGTIMYIVIATEGRVVAPLMARLGVDKMSMGLIMLFVSILVEDLPQIILTFLIEDYYEEGGFLSEIAVFNLMASLYDTCIKLAESYDQRHDVVETGVWCKKSITVHQGAVNDVLILPDDVEIPPPFNPVEKERSTSDSQVKTIITSLTSLSERQRTTPEALIKPSSGQISSSFSASFRLVGAFFPEEEAIAPQIHFLTTSTDRTGKLWNVSSLDNGNKSSRSPGQQCTRTYKDLESDGLTCLAWVGPRNPEASQTGKKKVSYYFLTGCNNGNTKLWDLSGLCRRSY